MEDKGRFLGIDYGKKRLGTAVSDENRTLAFPKIIIENTPRLFAELGDIIKKETVSGIVVGESTNLHGAENSVEKEISAFVLALEQKFGLPVWRQREFLTSVEARKQGIAKGDSNTAQSHSRRKKERSGRVDASAAALILQRYLDKYNKQK